MNWGLPRGTQCQRPNLLLLALWKNTVSHSLPVGKRTKSCSKILTVTSDLCLCPLSLTSPRCTVLCWEGDL